MKRAAPRLWGWPLALLLYGLWLVLLSGPIGDWHDFLHQLWSGMSSLRGHKFERSAGLDRFPGWLVLVAGWCCIALGLGGARTPPSNLRAGFARMRFRLRWLPVPILGTLGTYVGLAYQHAPPLLVTVDVLNAPPGATVRGGPIVGSRAHHESRYGATFDYLFGVPLPPFNVKPLFHNQPHSEFRFPAGRLSLQNWQPELDRVFVVIEDEIQRKSALVVLRVERNHQYMGTVSVNGELLKRCYSIEYKKNDACRRQVIPDSLDERGIRIVLDLAGIELARDGDERYFNVDLVWSRDR